MNFDEFVTLLSKIKNIELPAESSHFKMVPPTRKDFAKYSKEQLENAKRAGVLALFYPNNINETYFVLMLRKTYKGVHSAQVSFPGGKLEPDDKNIEETALRETFEEVGVPISDIEVIRPLSQVYIPPSNFCVQPFVGILEKPPVFKKEENEVEQIIEVKLSDLMNDDNFTQTTMKTSYSIGIEVPAFVLNGFIVWGATAMMLSEVKDVLTKLT
ncbi:NUDIX hydrolase [Hyunsoonleella pacifica]|uniref:CoA pyrophosphatase n=1 Tax=Hyunsoonleella pacifica TaxID=1080224 RepID=A0A4Q9FMI3_9FLAO|nr:CoA pyrophosphatase [Hyunsoonleella pacifica]TBN13027.1 CoA pyrophosphatase [Hyunsoonleella pacifica]GGD27753.1 coenzyme A pyrophosphatase [Hyunsoonleella pacifica]